MVRVMAIDHVNLARIDLNLLVAFDALVTEGHVTRAARKVGVGQPAMSHSLRRLRQLFADDLLVRSGTEMRPTPRALQLSASVRAILAELQSSVIAATRFDAAQSDRLFTIGLSPSLEIALAPKLLALVRAEAPGVRFSVRTEAPEAMLRALDEGRMDVAVGSFSDGAAHHKRRALAPADGYLCLFDAARTGLSAPVGRDDFLRLPHITVQSTDGASQALDRALAEQGIRRQVLFQTPHVLAVPYLLRETDAIALLCRRTALLCAGTFGLQTSPIPFDLPLQPVGMVWHASHDREPGNQWLRDRLSAAARAADP